MTRTDYLHKIQFRETVFCEDDLLPLHFFYYNAQPILPMQF